MTTPLLPEVYSVWQFLEGGISEKVRANVNALEAVQAAYHYTHNVAATAGITKRVIIVDGGDCITFEWLQGKGVVFPRDVTPHTKRDYPKE